MGTELTVGCLRRVGNMPLEMESLRREVHDLQRTTRGVGAMVHEPIAVLQQAAVVQQAAAEPVRNDASRDEQRELFRTVTNVRDLFLSGQHSTRLVLNNLELLRQDVARLEQGGHLSDGQLQLMREQISSDLRKELEPMLDLAVSPTKFSGSIPNPFIQKKKGGGE